MFIFDTYCCACVTFSVKVKLAPLRTEETVGDFCGVLLPPICVEVYVQVLTVFFFNCIIMGDIFCTEL